MSLEAPFGIGDFVEILDSNREEAGKRGYILRTHQDDGAAETSGADTSIFDVVLDEARLKTSPNETLFSSQTLARVVVVPMQDLKNLRGHDAIQMISMMNYMDKEYPCLGMAASSHEVCKINPESSHGRFARPPPRDLPGPHSCDRIFVNAEMEGRSTQIYNGDIVFAGIIRFSWTKMKTKILIVWHWNKQLHAFLSSRILRPSTMMMIIRCSCCELQLLQEQSNICYQQCPM